MSCDNEAIVSSLPAARESTTSIFMSFALRFRTVIALRCLWIQPVGSLQGGAMCVRFIRTLIHDRPQLNLCSPIFGKSPACGFPLLVWTKTLKLQNYWSLLAFARSPSIQKSIQRFLINFEPPGQVEPAILQPF